jgi:RNA polymerase sigma factor (sigma-70 family)
MIRPFADDYAGDIDDAALVLRAREGDGDAIAALVERHQPWIYNIARRMLYRPADAEDATQEIPIKVVTKLSTFADRSSFRTWLYRIVVNHVLNVKRVQRAEPLTFSRYAAALDRTPELDLPDPATPTPETQLLVDEARIGCTSGLLLCLSEEQRLIYILGGIFGVSDRVGAELLEISRDNYRQKLARARADLHNFMHGQCGLVNSANPCRCHRKTLGFVRLGYIDPEKLIFATDRTAHVREVAEERLDALVQLDADYAEIFRGHPFHRSPDFVGAVRNLLQQRGVRTIIEGE